MTARQLPDGRLCFPNRGTPPKPVYGYEVDPRDPFIHVPIYDACDHRTTITYQSQCGRICGRKWCKLHDKEATPETCEDCPDIMLIPVDGEILDAKSEDAPNPIITNQADIDAAEALAFNMNVEVTNVSTDGGLVQENSPIEAGEASKSSGD